MIRKVASFINFLEIFILIVVFLLFVLTSEKTLNFVLSKVSKEYSLTYERVNGTLLTGIEIDKVYYKGHPLADEIVVDWRILPLFYKRLSFSELKLSFLNIDTALLFMKEHKSDENKSSEKKSSFEFEKLPFTIEAKRAYLSISPYSYEGFDIRDFYFEIRNFKSDLKDFYIEEFGYFLKSNFLSLKIDGFLEDKNIYVKNLEAKNINLKAILESSLLKEKEQKKEDGKKKKQTLKENDLNLPIEGVVFEKIMVDIDPYKYKEYELRDLKLKALNGFFDLKKYLYFDDIFLIAKTNIADVEAKGKIDQSKIFTNASFLLNDKFLQKYSKDIDFSALNPIKAGFEVSKEMIRATVFVKSKNILKGELSKYDVKIKDMKTVLNYAFDKGSLHAVTDAVIENIYTKKVSVKNILDLNETLSYKGDILVSGFKDLPPDIIKVVKNLKISYESQNEGKGLKGYILSDILKGDFDTKEFKKLSLNLNGKSIRYFDIKAGVDLKTTIDLKNTENSKINLKLFTDYANLDSKVKLTKPINVFSKVTPSKKTGLKPIEFFVDTNITDKDVSSVVKSEVLNGFVRYDLAKKDLETLLEVDSSKVSLRGNLDKELMFTFSSYSLRELEDEIRKVYEFEKVPIDGEVFLNAKIDPKNMEVFADVNSKWLLYEYEKNRFLVAENFKTSILTDKKLVKIKNYSFNIMKRKFFATKESDIYLNENNITVDRFYINDNAYLKGTYDKNSSQGKFSFKADRFKYEGNEGKIVLGANIDINIAKDKTEVEGDVKLYEGLITYEPTNEYKVNDKDIVIIQREKPKKKEKDTLSLNIHIESKKPIVYKVDGTEVKFNVDVTLWKEIEKKLQLLGMVKVLKGRVEKQNKVFKIEDGEVLFGGAPSNPYLNIEISHEVKPYHITIMVTGTLESPVILFSSDPYLSQSDILSLILFGTTSSELMEGGASASNQVVSMFGNALAKDLADSLGIKLDRLALSAKEDGSIGVEVGKKITKNITLIYKNDTVSTIVVEIEHSPKFETDITIKPNSSGIDFIYKKEY